MTNVFLDGFEFSVKYEEGSFFQREDRLGDSGERLSWEQCNQVLTAIRY